MSVSPRTLALIEVTPFFSSKPERVGAACPGRRPLRAGGDVHLRSSTPRHNPYRYDRDIRKLASEDGLNFCYCVFNPGGPDGGFRENDERVLPLHHTGEPCDEVLRELHFQPLSQPGVALRLLAEPLERRV